MMELVLTQREIEQNASLIRAQNRCEGKNKRRLCRLLFLRMIRVVISDG